MSKIRIHWLLLLGLCMMAVPLLGNTIAQNTVNWLAEHGLNRVWIVLIISMLPIIELRGSIPVAVLLLQLPWPEAVALSVIGNMLPIPLVLLLMDWFFNLISKNNHGARLTEWLFARTRRKGKSIEKYEELGLAIFVGIPLPGTGAWTGAFAANIFGLNFWKSLLFILVGVLLAAGLVTPLTLMGKLAVG